MAINFIDVVDGDAQPFQDVPPAFGFFQLERVLRVTTSFGHDVVVQ